MDLWSPPHDAPHLLEWWRPLLLVSRRARLERFPWPVHLDEFRLAGRVNRQGRPDVWVYDHHENGGSVCVDAAGQTYKFIATPRARSVGQFRPCPLRTALWRARLPDVVAPVWFEEPPRRPEWHDWPAGTAEVPSGVGPSDSGDAVADDADADDADGDARGGVGPGSADPVRVIRRGHLTLIAA